jgi:hypothetical protein
MAGLGTILILLLLASITKAAEIDLYSKLLDIERIVSAQGKRITELEGTVTYQEKEIIKLNDVIKVLQLSDKDVGTIPENDDGNYSKDVDDFGSHLEPDAQERDHYQRKMDPNQTNKTRGELDIFIFVGKREEEFEETKRVIRIRISKKNRKHYDQKKKSKSTNNDLQNIHLKLKIE